MTTRKFTMPTEFPTTYTTSFGVDAVVLGSMPNGRFLGYVADKPITWGCTGFTDISNLCLIDKPKRVKKWLNVYSNHYSRGYDSFEEANRYRSAERLAVYCIEMNEDGSNPTIEVVKHDRN